MFEGQTPRFAAMIDVDGFSTPTSPLRPSSLSFELAARSSLLSPIIRFDVIRKLSVPS